MRTLDEARDLIDKGRQAFLDKRRLDWGITFMDKPRRVIGRCGYNYWLQQDRRASIGYDLGYAYWGHGIMTEAVHAMVSFRLLAHEPQPHRSRHRRREYRLDARPRKGRLPGAKGVQRDQYFEWDEFHDLVLFALLRKDFLK